ncbi:hypothetical protein [Syntrophomonas palmitatica]|nr:hypothetical protein [Syntrophomonas palmitatica]
MGLKALYYNKDGEIIETLDLPFRGEVEQKTNENEDEAKKSA